MEEISREYYLAHSGHKPTRRAAADLREARRAFSAPRRSTLTREAFRGARRGQRGAALGARSCSTGRPSRRARAQLAALDEREIAWEGDRRRAA